MEVLPLLTTHWVTIEKPLSIIKNITKIIIEIGRRADEGMAYGNLGNAYQSLGGHRKATENYERHLKIAIEISNWGGEGGAYQFVAARCCLPVTE